MLFGLGISGWGIVVTMQHLDGPPGKNLDITLVRHWSEHFSAYLSYGMLAPVPQTQKNLGTDEAKILWCLKTESAAVEFARKAVFSFDQEEASFENPR